jgi:hypothetical protein
MPKSPARSASKSRPLTERDDVQEFETYDEALAALYTQLEPGGSIDLHHEDCALAFDGPDCSCVPLTLTSGAKA